MFGRGMVGPWKNACVNSISPVSLRPLSSTKRHMNILAHIMHTWEERTSIRPSASRGGVFFSESAVIFSSISHVTETARDPSSLHRGALCAL